MSGTEDLKQTENGRPQEYPLSDWGLEVERALKRLHGRPRHSALNAVRGMRRAWLIAPIDPEIAVFRAITAEEEAATALIAALQRRRYPGAAKLDPKRHIDKAGWTPFLQTIETMLAETKVPALSYRLLADRNPPRIDVLLPGPHLGLGDLVASPDEPLNLVITEGGEGKPAQVMKFREQLERRALANGAKNILELVRAEANLRNKLLYASDQGWAVVEDPDAFLLAKRKPVTLLLSLTIAILQTPKHQLLVIQVVEAYLEVLGRAVEANFDFSEFVQPRNLRC